MIDLHCHILPGVDDGARSLEESVALCRAAERDGCEALVATPHQRHPLWWNEDLSRLESLRRDLARQLNGTPRIFLGGEVRGDSELLSALDRLSVAPTVSTLAGSRYLLLEFDPLGVGPDPEELVHETRVLGLFPIIAHPECTGWLSRDIPLVARLIDAGASIQITGSSLLGDFGRRPQECARELVDRGLVHFVASDCHRVDHRPPQLARAREELSKRWGDAVCHRLLVANPRRVLSDRPLRAAA